MVGSSRIQGKSNEQALLRLILHHYLNRLSADRRERTLDYRAPVLSA
ncbi:Uncharacterised protein [Vibrio cholerae]|nr:Uncharacterised protein [Vibrio cholerae]CSI41903.1 Uncharacterised protein [Vibrio cholerae]